MKFAAFILVATFFPPFASSQNPEWSDPTKDQFHIQTDEGPERYFKYQTQSGQYRKEKRLEDGTVIGSYGWIDDNGYLRLRDYIADNAGYRILKTKNVYVGRNRPIAQAVSVAKKAPAEAGTLVKSVQHQGAQPLQYTTPAPPVYYTPTPSHKYKTAPPMVQVQYTTPAPPVQHFTTPAPPIQHFTTPTPSIEQYSTPAPPVSQSTQIYPGYPCADCNLPYAGLGYTPSVQVSPNSEPSESPLLSTDIFGGITIPSTTLAPPVSTPANTVYISPGTGSYVSTTPRYESSTSSHSSPSNHVSLIPSHETSLPNHLSSLPSHVSSLPSHVTSLSSHVTSLSSHVTSTPSYVSSTPSYVTSTPSYVTSDPSYVTSAPSYVSSTPSYVSSTLAPPLDSNSLDFYSSDPQYEHYRSNPYVFRNGPTYPIDRNGNTFTGYHSNNIGNGYDSQYKQYDGVSVTNDGFRYYIPRAYHEEQNVGNEKSGSFGYIDPFGIRRVIYYSASPERGFQHRKNNRYVGFDATPYDPRPY